MPRGGEPYFGSRGAWRAARLSRPREWADAAMKRLGLDRLPGLSVLAALALAFGTMHAGGQSGVPGDYYETCRKLGFIPGTTPMRRCIQIQRGNDLDPMSALSDYKLLPETSEVLSPSAGVPDGNFSGADSSRTFLESSPEELLLGPDFRANSQGIYE